MYLEIMVMPTRKQLTGCGYTWEHLLTEAGWNYLPAQWKPGVVLDVYTDRSYDIFWPGVNIKTVCYAGEVKCVEVIRHDK